jgi:hypothetical protein
MVSASSEGTNHNWLSNKTSILCGMFSCESLFCFRFNNGQYGLYRRSRSRCSDTCVLQTNHFEGERLMGWREKYHARRT